MRASIRDLLVIGTLGVVAAWLAAADGSGPEPPAVPAVVAVASGQEPSAEARLTPEVEGLWQRLRTAPSPLTPGRNPFAFAPTPRARAATPPVPGPSAAPEPAATVPASAQPALRLIGIAEDATASGAVRTAVLSGLDQLFLVKVGDAVSPRFTVTAIGPDVVELRDATSDEPVRLTLR